MLSIAHAAVGATIATSLASPFVSIPLILASHYALDAVHHHDAGTGLSNGQKTRRTALILGIFDLLLAGILVLLMYPGLGFSFWDLAFWYQAPIWGAVVGLLPDLLESPRNFLGYEPRWLTPLNRFHNSFHHSTPNIIAGLMPQILLLAIIWLLR